MKVTRPIADMAKRIREEIERAHSERVSEEVIYYAIKDFMEQRRLKFAREIGD